MGIKKASNSLVEVEKTENKIENYPPKLRQLYEFIHENYNFKTISQACRLAGLDYHSIRVMLAKQKKKGNNFMQLLYKSLDERNAERLAFVDDRVYNKSLESDMRAAELFYKRTGALQSGSGGDRVQVNNQINLSFMSPLPEDDIIIK